MDDFLRQLSQSLKTDERSDLLHGRAISLLGEIAAGRARFPALRHPLGFLYAPLLREGAWVLRLHIWLSDASRPSLTTSPIHDHTWQLTSFVVCGELENWVVEVEEVDNPTHRIFEIRGAGSNDRIQPTEQLVRFRPLDPERVKQGDRYVMAAGQFHFTEVPEGTTTATLLLAERKTTAPERSLGVPETPGHQVTRVTCPPEEFAEAAQAVLAALARARSGDELR